MRRSFRLSAPCIFLLAVLLLASCQDSETRRKLLNQFPDEQASADAAILTDDGVMKTFVKKNGPAATMEVLLTTSHETGQDCHNRAHELGRMSFEEFGSEIFKLVLPECHSGFCRGAIEAFFRKNGTDGLRANLSTICIDGLNGFFTHQCLHGIGHGLMAWSDYDLPAALEYCNLLPNGTGQSSCRTGAFMEIGR